MLSEVKTQTIKFLKTKDLYFGMVRYVLAIFMFIYALTKILNVQFAISGISWTHTQTLEMITGKQLVWAFFGYSTWFQTLLGFLELVPAIFILFRRTALLGGVLLLPLTINVAIINYAFNLWEDTKSLSVMLLFLNLSIFAFEWSRVRFLFLLTIRYKIKFKLNIAELALNFGIMIAVFFFGIQQLLPSIKETNELTGDWTSQHPYEWVLEREEYNGSVLAHRDFRIYFWTHGAYNEIGNDQIVPSSYSIDKQKKTIDFNYDGGGILKCKYSLINGKELRIEILRDNVKIVRHFKKRVINESKN